VESAFKRMADVGGMRDRTLTIGSSSKLLNLTGWRVGWMVGPAALIGPMRPMIPGAKRLKLKNHAPLSKSASNCNLRHYGTVGPAALVGGIRMMHSYSTFCAPTPLQLGVAAALEVIADEADVAAGGRALAAAAAAGAEAGAYTRPLFGST